MVRPWKVEVDSELRGALLLAPEFPVTHEFDVPAGATLFFGLGATGRLPNPTRFRITAAQSAAAAVTLFEASLSTADTELWRDVEIDLSDWRGRVELTAEVARATGMTYVP